MIELVTKTLKSKTMTCTKMILIRVSLANSMEKNFFKVGIPFPNQYGKREVSVEGGVRP